MTDRAYLPAAGRNACLWLYDPIMRLFGAQKVLRSLIGQAAIEPNQLVLDVGCGTGTLAVLIKRLHPTVEVIGLDPDPKALAQVFHGHQRLPATAEDRMLLRMREAGFMDAQRTSDRDTIFGRIAFYQARRPR